MPLVLYGNHINRSSLKENLSLRHGGAEMNENEIGTRVSLSIYLDLPSEEKSWLAPNTSIFLTGDTPGMILERRE